MKPGCNSDCKTANVYNRMSLVSKYAPPGNFEIVLYHDNIFILFSMLLHSVLNDFTGLAIAALIAWKLTVNKAINNAAIPATTNTHQPISTR